MTKGKKAFTYPFRKLKDMESFISFSEETKGQDPSFDDKWKVLIVDDEEDIHSITRLVLKSLVFDNRQLEFYSAYSAREAETVLQENSDISLILLDVVMETDDAGLQFVKTVRDKLANKSVRIILRTGQPGQAPEKEVISRYDINDYKEKTELTTTKLFTSVISSLRSYRDICTLNDQKKKLEEKVQLEKQLVQAQKMEAVGLLASGIIHDFNNHLAAISGFAQMIMCGIEMDACKNYAERIVGTVSKSTNLLSRLLVFSRKGKGEMRPVNVNTLATDSIELLKPKNKMVNIRLEEKIANCQIFGDSDLLQNAFINLGVNAVDAMPEGGDLTYKIDLLTSNESISGYYIKLEITDTGTGISEDIREKVFDPFFTTKEEGKGTGLGLSGVYGCVKKHNGLISVRSEDGIGTTFEIIFPLLQNLNVKSPENSVNSSPGSSHDHPISVYSSDKTTGGGIAQLLQLIGHRVNIFSEQDELVLYLKSDKHKFGSLVIFDIDESDFGIKQKSLMVIDKEVDTKFMLISSVERLSKYHVCPNIVNILNAPFKNRDLYNVLADALKKVLK